MFEQDEQEKELLEEELEQIEELEVIIDQKENYTIQTTSERSSLLRRAIVIIASSVLFFFISRLDHNMVFNPVLSPIFITMGFAVLVISIVLIVYVFKVPEELYHLRSTYRMLKFQNNLMEFLVVLPVLMLIFTTINAFFLSFSPISGTSMEPNFHDSEAVIFSHISKEYERFDVIIIYIEQQDDPYLIKRVIGLPGEQVIIDDNEIYIDGVLLPQDFIDQDVIKTYCVQSNDRNYCEFDIPQDSYFVLGDNRDGNGVEGVPSGYSIDSRTFGPVHKDNTFGKVVFTIDNIRLLD